MECRHCSRQEERDQLTIPVTVAQQVQGAEEGLTAVERQEWRAAQEADPTLFRVGQWVDAGARPAWPAVSALSLEAKAYYSQRATLTRRDGLLYRVWRAPGQGGEVWQLLVPKDRRTLVCQRL